MTTRKYIIVLDTTLLFCMDGAFYIVEERDRSDVMSVPHFHKAVKKFGWSHLN